MLCFILCTGQTAWAQSVRDAYSSTTPGQAYEPDYSDPDAKKHTSSNAEDAYDSLNAPSGDHTNSGHDGHNNNSYGGGYGGHSGDGHR